MALNAPVAKARPRSRARRFLRILLWTGGLLVLTAWAALHLMAAHFAKYDDPARLHGTIHILKTNAFVLRWVESRATNASLNLVFIHGSPGGAGVWASQFARPISNANYFAFDRPGYGGSAPALARPSLQLQADALLDLLVEADIRSPILVGHSYGGPIALLAALQHPDKIRGVLLIGGDVDPALEKPWRVQYLLGWRLTSWLLPGPLRQSNREMLTVRADLKTMQTQLVRLEVPVVMLHGEQDPLVPVENVAWLDDQLSRAGKSNLITADVHPTYNHFIPWEHPASVNEALHTLVRSTAAPD